MAINLICPECKSNLSLRARICKNCGYYFSNGKKYRVVVKDQNGRRISKVLNSLAIAKKLERKLKTQILENSLFGITKKPVIDEVWQKYLAWAKENKKSWKDDDMRWKCHVESYFAGKKMDTISAFDLQRVINAMKSKKDYAPATIKHVIVLIKRVCNWSIEMDLYEGVNPASKIKLPKNVFYPLELLKHCIIILGVFWDVRAYFCRAEQLATASWKLQLLRGGSN